MITVKNLNLLLNKQQILENISCEIEPGKITTFIGRSGAGKTTLLKTIAGLYKTPQKTIFLDGQDISIMTEQQRAVKIGFVFQNFNLFPHLTVLENCIDPLLIKKISFDAARKIAQEKLTLLGMLDFKDKYPKQLSGGQQQRVAIARALCLNPEIILLDEPTASLDPINTDTLITILKNLVQNGITIIASSQDMNFVNKIFDQVFFMQDGKIIESCNHITRMNKSVQIASFLESDYSTTNNTNNAD